MKKFSSIAPYLVAIVLIAFPAREYDLTLNNTPAHVHFSPDGGATEAIITQLNAARNEVFVQAYSFTSAPIAKAPLNAHKRGVKVQVILDKSQRREQLRVPRSLPLRHTHLH